MMLWVGHIMHEWRQGKLYTSPSPALQACLKAAAAVMMTHRCG
jgi:hypothetical protein